ncbi:MAG: hypothetical protein B5M51_03195 [Anaerolinea sp. 4484_236]|nr:MAG: hypothetical protein B5M51_03195 [Anaerolinea sp. 4484_236]
MSTISLPLPTAQSGHIRPLNIMRDLSNVADLVELCFQKTMDPEGQRYVQKMRHASRDNRFLRWASTSMPLSGYVWEEDKRIVGNISLALFTKNKERIFLISNVAVHPDYRRRGIAQTLIQMGLKHARQRRSDSIWLQADDNNLGAIKLYADLGFQPRVRRNSWSADAMPQVNQVPASITISQRPTRFWSQQYQWLQRAYPDEITWYRMPDWHIFGNGIRYWLHHIFVESDVRQWAAQKDGRLQAVVSWMQTYTRLTPLWLATAPDTDANALTALLLHARKHLISQRRGLYIDYPAGEMNAAITAAGFTRRRTLLWMRADGKR